MLVDDVREEGGERERERDMELGRTKKRKGERDVFLRTPSGARSSFRTIIKRLRYAIL